MNQFKFPSWTDVGVPQLVVQKALEMDANERAFNSLIFQLVFHSTRYSTVRYTCDQCQRSHTPERSEELSQCIYCQSKRVRCEQKLKTCRTPNYLRGGSQIIKQVIQQMENNLVTYFHNTPNERTVDWDWDDNIFFVQFLGGQQANAPRPSIAVLRAAILTPYIWDLKFDWAEGRHSGVGRQRLITDIISTCGRGNDEQYD